MKFPREVRQKRHGVEWGEMGVVRVWSKTKRSQCVTDIAFQLQKQKSSGDGRGDG